MTHSSIEQHPEELWVPEEDFNFDSTSASQQMQAFLEIGAVRGRQGLKLKMCVANRVVMLDPT